MDGTIFAQCMPTNDLSIYRPVTPAGESIAQLSYLVLAVAAGIFVIVSSVLAYCVIRFRHRGDDASTEPAQVYGSVPIELAWTAAPLLIVFFLVLVTTRTLWEVELDLPQPAPGDNTLFVTVVGRQWWWEYRYDSYNGKPLGFTTANELHLPASGEVPRRTYLRLASADVSHSFWVPRLGGKTDLIPGRVNTTWIETDSPGLYLGQCAEYCGTQHAGMLLCVQVDTPDEFATWLERESAVAAETADAARGKAIFGSLACINCHAVRGTQAAGAFGPDLTHLMSRDTLAAGLVPNNRENLRKWLVNPQSMKPGCLMPAFGLNDEQLDGLVAYLETLR